jgi:hypothetical protein
VGRLCGRRPDLHLDSEILEACEEAFGELRFLAAVEVLVAEGLVDDPVAEHVVGRVGCRRSRGHQVAGPKKSLVSSCRRGSLVRIIRSLFEPSPNRPLQPTAPHGGN